MDRAKWSINEWVAGIGISRATYYTLPDEFRPASVKIGKLVAITESPAAWLARVAKRGGVPVRQAA
jgi:hypothetical protein